MQLAMNLRASLHTIALQVACELACNCQEANTKNNVEDPACPRFVVPRRPASSYLAPFPGSFLPLNLDLTLTQILTLTETTGGDFLSPQRQIFH